MQKPRQTDNTYHGTKQGNHRPDHIDHRCGTSRIFRFSCANKLRCHNGHTAGKAGTKSKHQKLQTSDASHRRQRVRTKGTAHDDRIHSRIQLLKYVSCQDRQHKHQDRPEDISLCQIVLFFQFLLPNLSVDFALLLLYLSVLALSTL